MKGAAIFVFLCVNGTWALIAFLLYENHVPPKAMAIVLGVGILLGNLAAYAGVLLARKILRPNR